MHEYGIAQQMVATALRYAEANRARRITQLHIEISDVADESEDSLRMYLETLVRGTMAENAAFEIERVRVNVRCPDCGNEFRVHYVGQLCPRCNSTRAMMDAHDEFKLTSIEIEQGVNQ